MVQDQYVLWNGLSGPFLRMVEDVEYSLVQ